MALCFNKIKKKYLKQLNFKQTSSARILHINIQQHQVSKPTHSISKSAPEQGALPVNHSFQKTPLAIIPVTQMYNHQFGDVIC